MYRMLCISYLLVHNIFVHAQSLGVSVEAGQHFQVLKKSEHDAPFQSDSKYSLGSGTVRQFMFHYYPDSSNWHLSAGFRWLNGDGVVNARSGTVMSFGERAQSVTYNALGFTGRLTYRFELGPVQLLLNGGPYLPLINRQKEETWLFDSAGHSVTTAKLSNFFSAGFSGGLGVQTKLTERLKLFLSGELLVMNARVKSRSIVKYYDTYGRSLEDVYPNTADREVLYRNKPEDVKNNYDVLRPLFDPSSPTDKLTYTRSYSSIGLQFGLVFML